MEIDVDEAGLDEITKRRRKATKELSKLSNEEAFNLAVKVGIYNEDESLTKNYSSIEDLKIELAMKCPVNQLFVAYGYYPENKETVVSYAPNKFDARRKFMHEHPGAYLVDTQLFMPYTV